MESRDSGFRLDIQGLRGIAVLAVVAFHYFPDQLSGGFAGVDVFFVISGYLISRNLLGNLTEGKFSFSAFYLARARRLLPALVLVLATCAVVGWKTLLSAEHVHFGGYLAAGALFLTNFRSLGDASYFEVSGELKPLAHLWSLGIEEQFYLLWPLLLWLAWPSQKKLRLGLTVVTLTSFALNVGGAESHFIATFFSPLSRLWELSLGAWLAMGIQCQSSLTDRSRHRVSLVGLALLLGGLLAVKPGYYPTVAVLIPALGTAMLIAAGSHTWVSRNLLSTPGLTFLGAISYPLYLWHWPTISFTKIVYGETPSLAEKAALILLSLALAIATHYWVEIPVKAQRFSTRLTVGFCSLAMGCLLVLGLAVQREKIKSPLQIESEAYGRFDYTRGKIESERFGPNACFYANGLKARGDWRHCTEKTFPDAPTVMLVGDSLAAYLSFGLKDYLVKERINFMHLSASSCLPYPDKVQTRHCNAEAEYTMGEIRKIRPDVVVVYVAHLNHFTPARVAAYVASLQRGVKRIAEFTKQVILLGPTPTWDGMLPTLLYRRYVRKRKEVPTRARFSDLRQYPLFMNETLSEVNFGERVKYVSLKAALCNEQGCLTQVGPRRSLIVWDHHHLTHVGAAHVTHVAIAPHIAWLSNRKLAARSQTFSTH